MLKYFEDLYTFFEDFVTERLLHSAFSDRTKWTNTAKELLENNQQKHLQLTEVECKNELQHEFVHAPKVS